LAAPRDLRDWITLLEREGELTRVSAEVDPDLEITEIVDRTVKAGGPAFLFERPRGSQHPLLINQFGTERRMCLAFGANNLDDVGGRLGDVLEMQPPQGLLEKVRGLRKLKSIADSMPKTVRSGKAQEIVLEGDAADLTKLPIIQCWPLDGDLKSGEVFDLAAAQRAALSHAPNLVPSEHLSDDKSAHQRLLDTL